MKTLSGAMEELARQGYTQHFRVLGNTLQALGSGQVFRAPEVVIRQYHRFEGVSDPDDMSIVYAIESVNGARGTLVDAFGVYSSPAVGAFLDKVQFNGRPQAAHPSEREEGS
jgi:hypothetical protein